MNKSAEYLWIPGSILPEWNDYESGIWNPCLEDAVVYIAEANKCGSDLGSHMLILHKARDAMRLLYGFAIPNRNAVEVIKPYSPILEAGAGTGYWAEVMRRAGIDVLAVDNGETKYAFDGKNSAALEPFNGQTPLKVNAVEEISKHPQRNLFLCWPDYDSPFAFDCLKAFCGDFLIYVGEGADGCTGDAAFHELLHADFEEVVSVDIPQWWGLHDYLAVYQRK